VRVHDHLIIGAGPGGLQLAYCLEQAGRSYLVLEGSDKVASTFRVHPRHRKLISINKVYTGYDDREINRRWDWNGLLCHDERFDFRNYSTDYFPSADDLVRYLDDFAEYFGLAISFGRRIVEIDKVGDIFVVTDSNGRVERALNIVVATGMSRPNIPDIPGIEHSEDYSTMSVDPMDFCGERVLIVGKGNSAFETADNLVATTAMIHLASPETFDCAWRSHYVGDLRAVNNNLLDTYQLKSQNAILDAQIVSIERRGDKLVAQFKYEHADGEVEEIEYDRIITCTGFRFDTALFTPNCVPHLAHSDKFPAMTAAWESPNIPGLFFAGVITHSRDYRKKQSGFIHGFRYNTVCLAKILEERCYRTPYPRTQIRDSSEAYAAAALDDVNTSSALWQQSGFMCSVIVPERDGTAKYYKDMPIAYAQERFADHPQYWLVTLDFNQARIDQVDNVFGIERVNKHDVKNADLSTAIHPVIYHCSHGTVFGVHHVIEDLSSEWREQRHYEPLFAFFAATMATVRNGKPESDSSDITLAGSGSRTNKERSMKRVEAQIARRSKMFDRHAIFQRFGSTGPLGDAITFFPQITFFVMAFQDVLRINEMAVTDPKLRLIAQHHREEDAGHEGWFLHDTEAFGVKPAVEWAFGSEHATTRDTGYRLVSASLSATYDASRIALVLALEATGESIFSRMPGYLERAGNTAHLKYFAKSHHEVELAHEIHNGGIREILTSIELDDDQLAEAFKVVDITFDAMTSMLDHIDRRCFSQSSARA